MSTGHSGEDAIKATGGKETGWRHRSKTEQSRGCMEQETQSRALHAHKEVGREDPEEEMGSQEGSRVREPGLLNPQSSTLMSGSHAMTTGTRK